MPKRGLRLDLEEYNHIVHHRYLAKKRKDLEARVRLRAILLVHEGKTLEQVGQILEVARSTVQRWIERYRCTGVTGLLEKGLKKAAWTPESGRRRSLRIWSSGVWELHIVPLKFAGFFTSWGFHCNIPDKNSPKPIRSGRPHGLKRSCLTLKKSPGRRRYPDVSR